MVFYKTDNFPMEWKMFFLNRKYLPFKETSGEERTGTAHELMFRPYVVLRGYFRAPEETWNIHKSSINSSSENMVKSASEKKKTRSRGQKFNWKNLLPVVATRAPAAKQDTL